MRRLVLIAVLVAVAGCGGDETLDTATIESGIKQQVTAAGSPVSKVECPSDVKSETGTTFQCSATFENSGTAKVKVTQTGRNSFTYSVVPGSLEVPGSVLEGEIEKVLDQQGAPDAEANCPENVIVKVGTYVVCDLAGPKATASVKFTFSDASGTVDEDSVSTG